MDAQGVMEIGSGDFDYSQGQPNPDFECLLHIRQQILAEQPQLSADSLTISMGMSNDFEEAVRNSTARLRHSRTFQTLSTFRIPEQANHIYHISYIMCTTSILCVICVICSPCLVYFQIKAGSTMVRVGRSIFGQRAANTEKPENI